MKDCVGSEVEASSCVCDTLTYIILLQAACADPAQGSVILLENLRPGLNRLSCLFIWQPASVSLAGAHIPCPLVQGFHIEEEGKNEAKEKVCGLQQSKHSSCRPEILQSCWSAESQGRRGEGQGVSSLIGAQLGTLNIGCLALQPFRPSWETSMSMMLLALPTEQLA